MKKMTMRAYNKTVELANEEIKTIPTSQNRKAIKKIYEVQNNEIRKNVKMMDTLEIGKNYKFLVKKQINLGTKKWSDLTYEFEIIDFKYAGQTENFYKDENGDKVSKDRVVACIVR
jgi:hypothetical protein